MNKTSSIGHWVQHIGAALVLIVLCTSFAPVAAQSEHQTVLDAREALRKRDKARLAAARAATQQHALAQWVEYWELSNRLDSATQEEIDAFYVRWSGTYVEDRLRNDWLLELGRRRDWVNFRRDYPSFRMNDDRQVVCYALLTQHLDGREVRDAARAAWYAQRELDDGCELMAKSLYASGAFGEADAWHKARLAIDDNRPAAARAAAALISADAAAGLAELSKDPARTLARLRPGGGSRSAELATLALMQLARQEPDAAVALLENRWQRALPAGLAALAWASAGKHAGLRLQDDAARHYQRAVALRRSADDSGFRWPDDTLAWQVRAALRHPGGDIERAALVIDATDAMNTDERQDAAWVYWRARSLRASAPAGATGDAQRLAAQHMLESIAGQLSFYGNLAAEDLGQSVAMPSSPRPLTTAERAWAARHAGLERALLSIRIGLRSEGVREWNYSLRGMNERELLAAAQLACDHEVWDRCINTSDRTRDEVDLAQRFPTPHRERVQAQSLETGVDPAYVYGLIRQESRFIMDARSGVGASGLMQLMPATARWTAKKIGLPFSPQMITDRDINLRLGTAYLKLVLDDFGGSQTLASAAYNAGPSRPRRWRDGPVLEPAAWAENIPFNETRDYVKKVLSNAVYYGARLNSGTPSLKSRLGPPVGPRDARAASSDRDLP